MDLETLFDSRLPGVFKANTEDKKKIKIHRRQTVFIWCCVWSLCVLRLMRLKATEWVQCSANWTLTENTFGHSQRTHTCTALRATKKKHAWNVWARRREFYTEYRTFFSVDSSSAGVSACCFVSSPVVGKTTANATAAATCWSVDSFDSVSCYAFMLVALRIFSHLANTCRSGHSFKTVEYKRSANRARRLSLWIALLAVCHCLSLSIFLSSLLYLVFFTCALSRLA